MRFPFTATRVASEEPANLEPPIGRICAVRLVLIGEASLGTSEFRRMRARNIQEHIEHQGFSIFAIDGDWPDAPRIDRYARNAGSPASEYVAFARFPIWMWRNEEFEAFIGWLLSHSAGMAPKHRVAVHSLDLYISYASIEAVLDYLDQVDPDAARTAAHHQYRCLAPWQDDPWHLGRLPQGASTLPSSRRRRQYYQIIEESRRGNVRRSMSCSWMQTTTLGS